MRVVAQREYEINFLAVAEIARLAKSDTGLEDAALCVVDVKDYDVQSSVKAGAHTCDVPTASSNVCFQG
jgi:hypothetical protein